MNDSLKQIVALLQRNLGEENPHPLALFSDFDGTLAPIAPTPDEAHILPQALDALRKLAHVDHRRLLVGILSGRRLTELRRKLPLDEVLLAGNHGLEVSTSGGGFIHPQASLARAELERFQSEMEPQLARFPGAWIEDKQLGLAVHYRQLDPQRVPELEAVISQLASTLDATRLVHGRSVWELRPAIEWDKGKALAHMLEIADAPPNTLSMYFGDDTTDEDAFREVNQRNGLSVLVREQEVPTQAGYRLASPEEVADFLSQVALLYNE